MTKQEMQAELDRLKAENQELYAKAKAKPSGGIKVSQKGAVSVYGLGRFPVTLYKGQWETLLGKSEEIKSFIKANDSQLATKD